MNALDTNQDGELSANEIENAVAALNGLDKDNNGKLTQDEFGPRFSSRDGFRDGPSEAE